MISVLLGLGSNCKYYGKKPVELLASACNRLFMLLSSPVFSSIYESKAMYVENQDNFYNMVVKGFVDDSMNPFELLNKIHEIEAELGRDRSKEIRFGPRSIDVDIEEFGNLLINHEPDLILPHPRIHERAFVLIPALEILKESADEKLRERFEKYLTNLPDQGVEKCSDEIQNQFKAILNCNGGVTYGKKSGKFQYNSSC